MFATDETGLRTLRVALDIESPVISSGLRAIFSAVGIDAIEAGAVARADAIVVSDLARRNCGPPFGRVIALLSAPNPAFLEKAVDAGARGIVLRDGSSSELCAAVTAVQRGEVWFSPSLGEILLMYVLERRPALPKLTTLTRRQRAVLDLLVLGSSNAEIASGLSVSVSTVKQHISALLRVMGAHSRAELIALVTGQSRRL